MLPAGRRRPVPEGHGAVGWRVSRVRGSHRVLKGHGRTLVVAFHGSLSRNSVRRALREAGIGDAEFEAGF